MAIDWESIISRLIGVTPADPTAVESINSRSYHDTRLWLSYENRLFFLNFPQIFWFLAAHFQPGMLSVTDKNMVSANIHDRKCIATTKKSTFKYLLILSVPLRIFSEALHTDSLRKCTDGHHKICRGCWASRQLAQAHHVGVLDTVAEPRGDGAARSWVRRGWMICPNRMLETSKQEI